MNVLETGAFDKLVLKGIFVRLIQGYLTLYDINMHYLHMVYDVIVQRFISLILKYNRPGCIEYPFILYVSYSNCH